MKELFSQLRRDKKALWALIVLLLATAGVAYALTKGERQTASPVSPAVTEATPAPAAEEEKEEEATPEPTEPPAPTEPPVTQGSETSPAQAEALTVELCGKTFSSDAEVLYFAGDGSLREEDLQEIEERAPEFPKLELVDLTDCGFESERLHELDVALGEDIDVAWCFEIYGVTVCSTDEEIDLSGHTVWDKGAEVEAKMVWMPHLRRVVMADCLVRDKDMGALNDRHEDVRFVWRVQIKWGGIMTDATWFTPYPESGAKQYPTMAGVEALYYCPDLIALDLGHTNMKNLNFLGVMPHLKYLILADNWLRDIEMVGTLKELTWLELFKTGVTDLTPLLGCPNLTDLNICYIPAKGDHVYETLRQMKSLKRIWCCGTLMSEKQLEELQEELPECEIWAKPGDESTGSTWRYSDSYYDMRDAFHMYYMSWDGNTVGRLSEEELEDIHNMFWGV